jgi:hypothetical protein
MLAMIQPFIRYPTPCPTDSENHRMTDGRPHSHGALGVSQSETISSSRTSTTRRPSPVNHVYIAATPAFIVVSRHAPPYLAKVYVSVSREGHAKERQENGIPGRREIAQHIR